MKNSYPHRFRDPIHGFIHVSDAELGIIDSPAFQRLRNIKQLAFTYYVYPGAMHTRFEHSLGVMELASKAFDYLVAKHGTELRRNFKAVDLSVDAAKDVLRLAGLLHDIGHLPFSHGGESVLPVGKQHEDVSVYLIENYYKGFLEKNFFKGVTKRVSSLIKKEELIPELRILRQLLSGQLDADRMDYLIRDSLHCGVRYGSFDYRRLVESLAIIKSSQGGYQLAIERGGVHSLEALLLARYFMFTQVYLHRTRRIYDIYLKNYLKLWNTGQYKNLSAILEHDDITLFSQIRHDSLLNNSEKTALAKRIVNREQHSMVFETNDHADAAELEKAKGVLTTLGSRFGKKLDLIIDSADGTTHKFHVEGDEKLGEEFYVIDKFGRMKTITQESKIIQKVPKYLRVVRVYASGKKENIEKARDLANQLHA